MELGAGRRLIIAVTAGGTTGLLLGDHASIFDSVGKIYFLATQVAIIPFLVSSLLLGLGRMDTARARRLFKSSWKVFCLVWAVTVFVIFSLAVAIPQPQSENVVFQQDPNALGKVINSLLKLTIPSNPIAAIAGNQIPAIVLFCIAFGIALHTLPGKERLLDILKLVADGSCKFWEWLAAILPIALFALSASLFGTLDIQSFPQIIFYLLIVLSAAALLILWLLPAMAAALLDVPFYSVLKRQWKPLTIALITNSSPVAIPASAQAVGKFLGRRSRDPEVIDIIMTTLSLAFVFMRCGQFFNHLFISFAAYFYQQPLSFLLNLALLPISLFSCIGGAGRILISSVNSYGLPLQLPESAMLLYSQTSTVVEYPNTVLSTLSTTIATLLATMNYYGLLQVNWRRLLRTLGLGVVTIAMLCLVVSQVGSHLNTKKSDPIMQYRLDPQTTEGIKTTIIQPGEKIPDSIEALQQLPPGMSTMERIGKNGTLLVGYNQNAPPFCYFNSYGELVGYDVAFMYALADALKVKLVFVPFLWGDLRSDLKAHRFDIACCSIYLTVPRIIDLRPSDPYFNSPVAFFGPPGLLKEALEPGHVFSVKMVNSPALTEIAAKWFPKIKLSFVESYFPKPDLAPGELGFADLGNAVGLTRIDPKLAYMQVGGTLTPLSFVFLMAPDSEILARCVNYKIHNLEAKGTAQASYHYWILGEGSSPTSNPAGRFWMGTTTAPAEAGWVTEGPQPEARSHPSQPLLRRRAIMRVSVPRPSRASVDGSGMA